MARVKSGCRMMSCSALNPVGAADRQSADDKIDNADEAQKTPRRSSATMGLKRRWWHLVLAAVLDAGLAAVTAVTAAIATSGL